MAHALAAVGTLNAAELDMAMVYRGSSVLGQRYCSKVSEPFSIKGCNWRGAEGGWSEGGCLPVSR